MQLLYSKPLILAYVKLPALLQQCNEATLPHKQDAACLACANMQLRQQDAPPLWLEVRGIQSA